MSAYDDDSKLEVLILSMKLHTMNDYIDCNGACEVSIIIAGDYNARFHDIFINHRLIAAKTLLNNFDLICCDDRDVSGI